MTARFAQLEPSLRFLGSQQDAHFNVVGRLCGVPSGHDSVPLFEIDVVLLSVLNRSLDLIDGFRATFDRWNLTSAAPQVRMQVDNLLRLNLVLLASQHRGEALDVGGASEPSYRSPGTARLEGKAHGQQVTGTRTTELPLARPSVRECVRVGPLLGNPCRSNDATGA